MIDLDPADLSAARDAFPPDGLLVMINLLRFREEARYTDELDRERCTGRTAYFERYVPAFSTAVEPFGTTQLLFAGDVAARLVGPAAERWDAVAVVQYPNFAVFHSLMNDPTYLRLAEPHRDAALADWRLLATTKI